MEIVDILPLMIGAAAILHCGFLIIVLYRLSGKLANQLLAAILLFLAIRMAGCIAGLMYSKLELSGLYLGAISFALVGPLIYAYLYSLWNPSFRLQPNHIPHIALALVILLALPFLSPHLLFGLYMLSLLSMMIYGIVGMVQINKVRATCRMDEMRWKWTKYFMSAIASLFVLFISQSFFFDAFVYQGIIIGSAFVLYALTIVAVRQSKLFMYEPSRKNKQQKVEELGKKIKALLSQEEIFTNPLMSVSMLAKELNEPAYLVSLAINSYAEKSFPEMLNAFRIQKAEQLLMDPGKSHFTIEAIAYESGFSAMSAFYTTFKRVHRKTPNKFRNHYMVDESHGTSARNASN